MSAEPVSVSGGCLCTSVRFSARLLPRFDACHCSMCRRWGGGPWLSTGAAEIGIERGEDCVRAFPSSQTAERAFCSECGSHLWFRTTCDGKCYLSLGAIDDASGFQMDREICFDAKPGSYAFAGEHPRMTSAEFTG